MYFSKIYENGKIRLGHRVFFNKRCYVVASGGVLLIGNNVSFNHSCTIVAMDKIVIGDNCKFGEMVSIYDHDHYISDGEGLIGHQGYRTQPIVIGSNVWFGGKTFVKAGVTIGDNVIVAAMTPVTQDIPSNSLVFGNPCTIRPLTSSLVKNR